MLIALLIALVAINIAYLIMGDRRDGREHAREAADRAERADLLQRIQAPQAAVIAHHAEKVGPVQADDGMPMSDEEVAEQQERDRVISMIEAAENGRLDLLHGNTE